jgi:hypothetical protein
MLCICECKFGVVDDVSRVSYTVSTHLSKQSHGFEMTY